MRSAVPAGQAGVQGCTPESANAPRNGAATAIARGQIVVAATARFLDFARSVMNAAQRRLCAALCAAFLTPSAAVAATYTARLRFAPAASAALAGYFVRVRSAVTNVETQTDVGLPALGTDGMVAVSVPGLDVRTSYFFTVVSYDATGAQSVPSNELSVSYATVASQVDSDGDGLSDAQEDPNLDQRVGTWETDPERPDSDGDGVLDGQDQCGATAPGSAITAAGCPTGYTLFVSKYPNRARPISLDGRTLGSKVFVFVRPEAGVREVRFWLDDPAMRTAPRQREAKPPYDFRGGSLSLATAFDTTTVADGPHTITAAVTTTSGAVRVLTAAITIANATCGGSGCDRGGPEDTCDEPGSGAKQLAVTGRHLRAKAVLENAPEMDPTVGGITVQLRDADGARLYESDVLPHAFTTNRLRRVFRLARESGRSIGVRRLVLRRRGEQVTVQLTADAPDLGGALGTESVLWGVRIGMSCMRVVPLRCVARAGGVRCR